MKIEKYALLDTDFISKTHFIHGDTEKCLVDLVVEMPGYCFFCHSQIIKELSRHNQQAIGWLSPTIELSFPLHQMSSAPSVPQYKPVSNICHLIVWYGNEKYIGHLIKHPIAQQQLGLYWR